MFVFSPVKRSAPIAVNHGFVTRGWEKGTEAKETMQKQDQSRCDFYERRGMQKRRNEKTQKK